MSTLRTLATALVLAGIGLIDVAPAFAANVPRIKNVRVRDTDGAGNSSPNVAVVVAREGQPVNFYQIELEDIVITHMDVSVDGQPAGSCAQEASRRRAFAPLGDTAPKAGALVDVTVNNKDGKAIARFHGHVDGAGGLWLFPDKSNVANIGIVSPGGSIETLEIAHHGIEVGLVIQGGDVAQADSASFVFTEKTADPGGSCTKLGCSAPATKEEVALSGTKTAAFTVPFGEAQDTWSCGLAGPFSGSAKLKVKAWGQGADLEPVLVDSAHVQATTSWEDRGSGVNALPVDEDPLTSVAMISDQLNNNGTEGFKLAVVSDGWDPAAVLPTHAEIEVEAGPTVLVAAGSYQVTGAAPLAVKGDVSFQAYGATWNGEACGQFLLTGPGKHQCKCRSGFLAVQVQDGAWTVSATAFAADAKKLPPMVVVAFPAAPATEKGAIAPPPLPDVKIGFDPEIAVVFSQPVGFAQDPFGANLTGRVRLFAADAKGKISVLTKGKFAGQISTNDSGRTNLASLDPNGGTVNKGDILIIMEPAEFEKQAPDAPPPPPPVIVYKNGKGTRAVATGSNGKPGLL